ncbi:hypothetical protein, partial [Bradyrhizobium sp. TM233]|uniref:hypothetical protein n=1 Tax=Bradyrhizobium sp. TM233 TaxID=2599801 RepID=UPI0030C6DEFE
EDPHFAERIIAALESPMHQPDFAERILAALEHPIVLHFAEGIIPASERLIEELDFVEEPSQCHQWLGHGCLPFFSFLVYYSGEDNTFEHD